MINLEPKYFLWPDFDGLIEDMKDHEYIIERFDEPLKRQFGYISTNMYVYRWLISTTSVWNSNYFNNYVKNNLKYRKDNNSIQNKLWQKDLMNYINEDKKYGKRYYELGFDKQDNK